MSQIKITLADLDREYLLVLEKCFIDKFQFSSELSIITDAMYLQQYFSSPRTLDILLINEKLYSQEFSKHNIAHLFILAEEKPVSHNSDTGFARKIYKYSGAKEILHQIISYSRISEKMDIRTGVAKTICVYSPIGGAGQTTIAAGLCASLARSFQKVLFVSLDSLQSFGFLLSKNQRLVSVEKSLVTKSQYVYDKIKPLIVSEFYDILPPFTSSLASLSLSVNHMHYLIDRIKHSGDYDYVIIDCSRDFSVDTSQIMADSNHVIMIALQDPISTHKFECLLNCVDTSDASRFIFVCNKFNKLKENQFAALNIEAEYIPDDSAIDPRSNEYLTRVPGIQKISQLFL